MLPTSVIPFDNTDKAYLYYLLSTNAVKYDIANRAYGGANQVNVSPKDIKNIKWCFPTFQEQKRIADILSAYPHIQKLLLYPKYFYACFR